MVVDGTENVDAEGNESQYRSIVKRRLVCMVVDGTENVDAEGNESIWYMGKVCCHDSQYVKRTNLYGHQFWCIFIRNSMKKFNFLIF